MYFPSSILDTLVYHQWAWLMRKFPFIMCESTELLVGAILSVSRIVKHRPVLNIHCTHMLLATRNFMGGGILDISYNVVCLGGARDTSVCNTWRLDICATISHAFSLLSRLSGFVIGIPSIARHWLIPWLIPGHCGMKERCTVFLQGYTACIIR